MKLFVKKIWVFICITILLCNSVPCQAAEQSHKLSNPVRKKKVEFVKSSYEDGYVDSVTWDCIWFGSYPQTIVDEKDSVYKKLQKYTSWDENGDAVIGKNKYRRYKDLNGKVGYFKYEPIKWRVLNVSGNQVTLISDLVLEYRPFSDTKKLAKNDSWQTSTMRSYLNGYSAKSNAYHKAYNNKKSFIMQAFTKKERNAILKTTTYNNDMAYKTNTGKATSDKIFLPAEADVCQTKYATSYGFPCDYLKEDNSRLAMASDYSASVGNKFIHKADKNGDVAFWGLRTNSSDPTKISYVGDGIVGMFDYVDNDNDIAPRMKTSSVGIRPMMNMNLSLAEHCYYAGSVSVYPNKMKEVKYSKKVQVTWNKKTNTKKPKSGVTKGFVDFDANNKLYTIDGITYQGYISAGYYEWDYNRDIDTMYMLTVVELPQCSNVEIPHHVTIGNTECVVTRIAAKAAYNNTTICTVTMPYSIVSIGKNAFAGCKSLTKIEIPEKTFLEEDAFKDCPNLEIVRKQ